MTIQPLRDRIVFRHLERPETVLASGVVLPADTQLAGSSVLAEVLAVGPGRMSKKGKRLPPEVKVGDIVLVQKHAGAPVDQGTWGEGARSLPEDGILAIVESPGVFHGGGFLKQANQAEKGGDTRRQRGALESPDGHSFASKGGDAQRVNRDSDAF